MSIEALKPPPKFFEFKLAHLLTIVMIAGLAVGWWMRHEKEADTLDVQQSWAIEGHEKRIQELERSQKDIVPDIREIKTKIIMMAELLDGEHKKPDLHK